jgi:hypothetical protein
MRRHGVDEAYVRAYLADDLRLEIYLRQRFGTLAEPDDEALKAAVEARQREPGTPTTGAESIEAEVRRELSAERFAALVDDWIRELRGRGDVIVHGVPAGAGSDAGRD